MTKAIDVTDQSFQKDVMESNLPVLVDFWASWCGPCKMQIPVIDELSEEYAGKVTFAKVNTENNLQVAQSLGVSGIPALFLFKDGRIVERMTGFHQKTLLKSIIDRNL